jgi:hypothetical protein
VARIGENRNVYRFLVGKPEGKRPLETNAKMGGWDENGYWGDWLGVCRVDPVEDNSHTEWKITAGPLNLIRYVKKMPTKFQMTFVC